MTQETKKLQLQLKFLTCDYLTNKRLAKDHPHLSPACDLRLDTTDSIEHVLATCRATAEVSDKLFPELVNVIVQVAAAPPTSRHSLKFILDCTSLNLPDTIRIPAHNPLISIL